MSGPLSGLRIVELAGIGPAPFAAMLLGDLGAEIIRIERADGGDWPDIPVLNRNRASLLLDLKRADQAERCLTLIEGADVLIEGYRPGVMERLGFGPDAVQKRAPRLIYGRMTGWGQTGPLADRAGHDINYLALSGLLAVIGRKDGPPVPPLNLLGDYAAGALYLVIGILAALVERERSGRGQVVDAAIVDGAASLLAPILGMARAGVLSLAPGENLLGGEGSPFYRCYRCADGLDIAVGPLEARFRAELCQGLGLDEMALGDLANPAEWPRASRLLADIFVTKTSEEWTELFAGRDACVTPVRPLLAAFRDDHLSARETFVEAGGLMQPAPAPRFSRTPGEIRWHSPADAPSGEELAASWGIVFPS